MDAAAEAAMPVEAYEAAATAAERSWESAPVGTVRGRTGPYGPALGACGSAHNLVGGVETRHAQMNGLLTLAGIVLFCSAVACRAL